MIFDGLCSAINGNYSNTTLFDKAVQSNGAFKNILGEVTYVVTDVAKTAWDVGAKIDRSIESAIRFQAEMKGRTAFEIYASYLSDAYSYNLKFASINGLINTLSRIYEWGELQNKSIAELENLRRVFVTFANSDEVILDYLVSMRTINEKAGWEFVLKKEVDGMEVLFGKDNYPAREAIIDEIVTIRNYRNIINKIPANIQETLSNLGIAY